MTEIIFLVEEDVNGGYSARALDHSIFTDADTWDDLEIMIQEAINCHFELGDHPKTIVLANSNDNR
ncbi:MAG: 2-oxoisovalerate dehydrogenase [Chloroflexi bacterium]|nr:2-oxoisovalerate dehydrogenase [Chloroflexota bacterium]